MLSRFDFVAVQEVNELPEWETIVRILGPTWDFLATDVTDTKLGGNGERLTYLFDQRKVSFRHIAGEIVLPPGKLVSENVVPVPSDAPGGGRRGRRRGDRAASSPARRSSPRFSRAGSSSTSAPCTSTTARRAARSSPSGWPRSARSRTTSALARTKALKQSKSLILLGDFNIVHAEHETMNALLESGFKTPAALENAASNVGRGQVLRPDRLQDAPGRARVRRFARPGRQAAGGRVRDLQARLHAGPVRGVRGRGESQLPRARDKAGAELEEYYEDWRTYQFSDHLPMWVQLEVNDSAAYLRRLESR